MTDQPPQYRLTVRLGGHALDDAKPIDDPFITTTLTIGPEDLRAALDAGGPLEVVVSVDGTRAAYRHVMRPMDLTPNDEQPATLAEAATTSPQE